MKRLNCITKSKINSICPLDEYRSVFSYVYFIDNYMYSTDGYIAIKQKIEDFVNVKTLKTEENLKLLNNKRIHKFAFDILKKAIAIKIEEDKIKCTLKNTSEVTVSLEQGGQLKIKELFEYNYEPTTPSEKICLNKSVVNKLSKIMTAPYYNYKYCKRGETIFQKYKNNNYDETIMLISLEIAY